MEENKMQAKAAQLVYSQGDSFAPIPPHERGLQTVTAEYFAHVGDKPFCQHLEGLCFDRNGDLYYTVIGEGRVCRLDMTTGASTEIFRDPELHPTSVRIHKDGRLFISIFNEGPRGGVLVMNPDGSNVVPVVQDQCVDDMVFDSKGGFYYGELLGNHHDRSGSIWYCEPDLKSTHCVFRNLCSPNGIALNKDETHLWVTEYMGGLLHKLSLNPGPSVLRTSTVAYHFTGCMGPDSCSIDDDDNLYVAMQGQGRVLVFNRNGFPIGQILLPDRETGHNLCSSSVMVRPNSNEVYISSCDDAGAGPWIFKAYGFAKGNSNMYQFT